MSDPTPGALLRAWRKSRGLSQLELASAVGVSARHLSFVETGRSRPSRELLLNLAGELGLELRQRNQLLLAGGFAPVHPETPVSAPEMSAVMEALDLLMRLHDPFPALVMNRRANVVAHNRAFGTLLEGVAPHLLDTPINMARVTLHPQGLARYIVNLADVRAHVLDRLRRDHLFGDDQELTSLYREVSGYELPKGTGPPGRTGGATVILPVQLRYRGEDLAFFTIIAAFDSPLDVTVAELAIESFFPADKATEATLRSWAREWDEPPPDG